MPWKTSFMHLDRKQPTRRQGGLSLAGIFPILILSAFLVASGNAWAGPATLKITVVVPPDNAVLESALASLTLRLDPKTIDEIRLSVNDRPVRLPKREYKQQTACFDGIGLSFGMNDIKIVGMNRGKKVEEVRTRIFRRSDLSANASVAPDGFTRFFFHEQTQEKACLPCHLLDLNVSDETKSVTEKSPCHQCHKKILSNYATTHEPAADWSCLSCHDKKGSPRFTAHKPDSTLCNGCHENSWMSMKFSHGPTAAGSCATCHDPHASDYPFFLRTSPGEVCAGCHEEILTKPHVIGGSSIAGHPVRKSRNPYLPNLQFNCVSCHNPHAGNSLTFLQKYDGTSEISNFCKTCHAM